MKEQYEKTLVVAMIASDLSECEDFPEGPCVILRGSREAVKAAAALFDEPVTLTPVVQSK